MAARALFGFLLALFGASAPRAAADDGSRIRCETRRFAGKPVSWCHEWDVRSASKEVVYYFHGIGGSEKGWQDLPFRLAMREAVAKRKADMPHVFAISFGWIWFLSDVRKGKAPSRLDLLLRRVMAATERELKFRPESRVLVGESMGGYNSLRAGMADPGGFAKVVALCPALLPIGPYASEEEERKFAERNPHMNAEMVRSLKENGRQEFPRPEDWTRNNPLDRAELVHDADALPPALVSGNTEDEFGFHEGTALFAKRLAEKGGKLRFRSLPGSHCQHTPGLLSEAVGFVLP